MRAALVLIAQLLVACGNRDTTKRDAPSVGAGVPEVDWATATGPAGPLLLTRTLRTAGRWQFTGTVDAVSASMRATAVMELTSTGDGTAHLITTLTPSTGGEHRSELSFDEAGTSEDDPTGGLVAVLWPVPPHALSVGESATAPLAFPFNVQGRAKSDWTQTITFAGYSRVASILCARFTSSAVMELPDDGTGSFGRATYGAQFCLEPTTGMLVALANELTTEMSLGGPTTKGHVVNRFARDATP